MKTGMNSKASTGQEFNVTICILVRLRSLVMLVVDMPGQILAKDSLATAKLCVTNQKASRMASGIPLWAFSALRLLVITKILPGFALDLAATILLVSNVLPIKPTDKTTHHVAFPHSPVHRYISYPKQTAT